MADEYSIGTKKMETIDEKDERKNGGEDTTETLNSRKQPEPEIMDAIKMVIEDKEEDQTKEKEPLKSVTSVNKDAENSESAEAIPRVISTEKDEDLFSVVKELETEKNNGDKETLDDKLLVASSVIDMILTESEAKIAKKKVKSLAKDSITTGDKGLYIFSSCIV